MLKKVLYFLVFIPIISFTQTGDFQQISYLNFFKSATEISHLCDSNIYYSFSSQTDSLPTYKRVLVYDENGRQLVSTYINWDETESRWIRNFKIESTYDSHGNETSNAFYWWNPFLSNWHINNKEERTWDEDNHLLILIISDGSGNPQSASITHKTEYTYDADGKCSLETNWHYEGVSQQWIKDSKREYNYYGQETYAYYYPWDSTTSQWDDYPRGLQYIKEDNGSFTYTYYDWDKTNNLWKEHSKINFTFDAKGNRISNTDFEWDMISKQWINTSKQEYTYSPENELTFRLSSVWDTAVNQWRIVSKAECNYVGNSNIKVETLQSCVGNPWHIYAKIYYYYSNHGALDNIQIPDRQIIKIYPNPAKEVFMLETNDNSISSIGLYNARGQLVRSFEVKQQINRYTISNMKPGLYFIRITTPQGIFTEKLLKE